MNISESFDNWHVIGHNIFLQRFRDFRDRVPTSIETFLVITSNILTRILASFLIAGWCMRAIINFISFAHDLQYHNVNVYHSHEFIGIVTMLGFTPLVLQSAYYALRGGMSGFSKFILSFAE